MTTTWTEPARRLAEQYAGRGLDGLWVLLHTTELAVLEMAQLPGLDDDLTFTTAAMDLREALGAVRNMPQIATWNAHTFSDLVATRQLYAAGVRLSGDEVTDHDELVEAKLREGLAGIPTQRLLAVRDSYANMRHTTVAPEPRLQEPNAPAPSAITRRELGA